MGVVYRGEHVESGSSRAIKTVRVPYGSELAGLRCEIHALTRIQHPGIVRIVAEGLENGLPWYAMELLEGGTLGDYIAKLWNQPVVRSTTESDINETADAGIANPEVGKMETVPSGKPMLSGPSSSSSRRRAAAAVNDTVAAGAADPFWKVATVPSGKPMLPMISGPGSPSSSSRRRAGVAVNDTLAAGGADPEVWRTARIPGSNPMMPMTSGSSSPSSPRPRADAAGGKLSESLTLIRRLCTPLAFLHGSGIVHRDLKPANVFIRADGTPVLADFGLVSRSEGGGGREVIEVAGDVMGTTPYMSPEQIRGELVDARSDLYSLGCMLYQIITGRVPFVGEPFQVMAEHVSKLPTPPSEVVDGVSPELDQLVLSLLAKEPRQRLGHADDVAAILGELGASDPPPVGERPRDYLYRPDLAGRQDVLAEFSGHLTTAREGRGRQVLVGGESGVGKSCLAAAVARNARLAEMRVVTGECVPVATPDATTVEVRGAPLHPFRHLFEAIADLCREKGAATADRLVGERGKVLAAYEPALAGLPGQDAWPDPPEIPAQAERQRILNACSETLAAFAREVPLLLILDDLQWADELSLNLLATLGEDWFADKPLLILGTYRSEEVGESLREVLEAGSVARVELGRLDEKTVGLIVADMLAMPQPPSELVRVLARRSSGNPFFVAEYLRAAVAERLIYRERGQWRTAGASRPTESMYEALPLPGSLRELVGRRLDGLSSEARNLVEVAAVIGREADGDVLQAVAAIDQGEALSAVKELLGRQVLEEVRPGRFRFVHDKLREITYDRVAETRRREVHRATALALEARHADSTSFALLYSELAHHFKQAGDTARAIQYLERAGQQAQRTFANREAARFFSEAIDLDRRDGERTPKVRRAGWHRESARAQFCLGKLREALEELDRAVALLGFPMPQTPPRQVLGLLGQALRQLWQRLRPPRAPTGERAALLLEAARCYDLLMPVSYFATGNVLRILYATLANLNLAERAAAAPELALAYANMHVTLGLLPWFSLAEAYGRRALATLQQISDPAVRSWVHVLAGSYAIGIGAWDEARRLGEEAARVATEIGFPRRREEALGVLGAVYNLSGQFTRAREVSDEIYVSGGRGDPQTRMWALASVTLNSVPLDEPARALQAGEQAQKFLREYAGEEIGRPEKILANGTFALACLRSGDFTRARQAAERGLEAIEQGRPMAFYCISSYSYVAETFLELWRRAKEERDPDLDAIARLAKCACQKVEQSARVFPVHRPRALLFHGRCALMTGRALQARRLFERSIVEARARAMPYDEGLGELYLALAGGDAHHLERARALLEKTGARADVKQAEAAQRSARTST
jgi:tetratricopeptide (TPR) repeat protein